MEIILNGDTKLEVLFENSNEDKISNIFKKIASNPKSFALLEYSAKINNNLVIDFNPTMEKMFSQGEWNQKTNKISINGNLDQEELLKTTVFELCNSANPAFNNMDTTCFNNSTEYSEYIEKNEANSYRLAYEIYDLGIKNHGWVNTKDLSRYESLRTTKGWVESSKRNSSRYNGAKSHFEGYVKHYKREEARNKLPSENIR